MTNHYFSDYVTSGAFSLSLTRNQISSLGLVSCGEGLPYLPGGASLLRKGLVESVPAPTDYNPQGVEYRATRAGLLVAAVLQEAGLTNGPADPMAVELEDLRAQLVAMRQQMAEVGEAGRAAMARKDEAENELRNVRRELEELKTGARGKLAFTLRVRDPIPEVGDAEVSRRLEAAVTQ